ncbi:hypothetical protein ACOMHN_005793 [Nucella lapillus]
MVTTTPIIGKCHMAEVTEEIITEVTEVTLEVTEMFMGNTEVDTKEVTLKFTEVTMEVTEMLMGDTEVDTKKVTLKFTEGTMEVTVGVTVKVTMTVMEVVMVEVTVKVTMTVMEEVMMKVTMEVTVTTARVLTELVITDLLTLAIRARNRFKSAPVSSLWQPFSQLLLSSSD